MTTSIPARFTPRSSMRPRIRWTRSTSRPRVHPLVTRCATRLNEADSLVVSQRLCLDPDNTGCHADHEAWFVISDHILHVHRLSLSGANRPQSLEQFALLVLDWIRHHGDARRRIGRPSYPAIRVSASPCPSIGSSARSCCLRVSSVVPCRLSSRSQPARPAPRRRAAPPRPSKDRSLVAETGGEAPRSSSA